MSSLLRVRTDRLAAGTSGPIQKPLLENSRLRRLGCVARHVMYTAGMVVNSGGWLRKDFVRFNWQLANLWYTADRLA